MTEKQLAGCIESTLLSATTTEEQIRQLCQQAADYSFVGVCVNPRWVSFAADELTAKQTRVCSVIGFPLGADSTKIKAAAAKDAIFAGADEIDMVADLAAIVEGNRKYLAGQFQAVLKVCRAMRPGVVLKVIIETAALTPEKKIFACETARQCGIDFIKTSTGFHPAGGATVEDIRLIKETIPDCRIKAAGGIKTAKQAIEMLSAGADRIGTSSAVQIINEFRTSRAQ